MVKKKEKIIKEANEEIKDVFADIRQRRLNGFDFDIMFHPQ